MLQALFIFLFFYSVVYSIYVEAMYYSYLSVCPVGTTGNLIFYLILLIWFQHCVHGIAILEEPVPPIAQPVSGTDCS